MILAYWAVSADRSLPDPLTNISVFRTYVFPYMDRPNLTVLTRALVTKLTLEGKRATGVEIAFDGKIQRIRAGLELFCRWARCTRQRC